MTHRPTVETIREGSVTFVPTCDCGWKGVPVVKRASLSNTTGSLSGPRSLATKQLRTHVKEISINRIPSNVKEITQYA